MIATDISTTALDRIRVRSVRNWSPLDGGSVAGSIDLTYDLGSSSAQVMLPQSIGLEPSMTDTATAVIDNSDSNTPDDPNSPPAIRRVVRVGFTPIGGSVLVFLHHNCLSVVRPTSAPLCPGGMPNCTVSQWCEAQGLTCGNDGCCRPYDIRAPEIAPGDAGVDAIPPTDGGSTCFTMDAGTDAPADAPRG